jgi:hypothetical protein
MDHGKKRSLAQRIGSKGEKLFDFWSEDRGLASTKVTADYGVDFWCQVLSRAGKTGIEEATGAILAVQVRATEGQTRPRVKLFREDAVNLLRQTHATALVAVQPTANTVHFRFLDETFIDRLSGFLASTAETHSIRLDELQSDVAEFDRSLLYFTRPGTQHRLRIYKAEKAIASAVPGASLSVHQTGSGGLAVVDVPWLGSAIEVDPAARETVRTQVFEQGKLPHELPGISLKPALLEAADVVDGPVLLQGVSEAEAELVLRHDGQEARAVFDLRRAGDERGYTHAVGISFVISDARPQGDHLVHELHSRVFQGEQSLAAASEILPFLRLLRPGTILSVNGRDFGPIETMGKTVIRVGPAIEALEGIASLVHLDLSEVYLSDFGVEEFGYSVGFLDSFLRQQIPLRRFIPGFVVGPSARTDPDQIPTEPVRVELPIVLNLKNTGMIVWVRAQGAAFRTEEGRWCGLRMGEQLAWSFEPHARFDKSIYPEAWVFRYWPPLLISPKQSDTVQEFEPKGPEYFIVEADITKESGLKNQPDSSGK